MGATLRTFNILVIGLKDAGKTHLLDMLVFESDSTKIPTHGFYHATVTYNYYTRLEFVECPNLSTLMYNNTNFTVIILVIDAKSSFEELQTSKNMLLSILRVKQHVKVCVLYNHKPYDVPEYSFRERNQIIQVPLIDQRVPVSVIEVQFEDTRGYKDKIIRLFDWIIQE